MDVGGGSIVKGRWEQISTEKIKLNTFDQPKNPSTTYTGKINPDLKNKIKITISELEAPLGAAYVIVNNQSEGKIADVNGVVEFEINKITSIKYFFLGQEETIEINNHNLNDIQITVRDLDLNAVPRFLTDKIMSVNNRKLFFHDNYSLKKTKLKNRQWN